MFLGCNHHPALPCAPVNPKPLPEINNPAEDEIVNIYFKKFSYIAI
jgi:hypothetical protein